MTCIISLIYDRTQRPSWYALCATHGGYLGGHRSRSRVEALAEAHRARNAPRARPHATEVRVADYSYIPVCAVCGPLADDTVRAIWYEPDQEAAERRLCARMADDRAFAHEREARS